MTNTLLALACCANKLDHAAPAIELYQNRAWNLIRRKRAELEARGVSIFALSAEHGLVEADRELEPYDRRLGLNRSRQFAIRFLREADLYDHFDSIVVYGGELYRWPLGTLADTLEIDFHELVGRNRGCGDHYAALAAFTELP